MPQVGSKFDPLPLDAADDWATYVRHPFSKDLTIRVKIRVVSIQEHTRWRQPALEDPPSYHVATTNQGREDSTITNQGRGRQ